MKIVYVMRSDFEVQNEGWVNDLLVWTNSITSRLPRGSTKTSNTNEIGNLVEGLGLTEMFWLCCWRVGLLLMFGLFYRPAT